MALIATQLQALKADILAAADLFPLVGTPDGRFEIARLYNLAAPGPWVVWRTRVPVADIEQNGFVWASVDALVAGKARIWEWMRSAGFIQPNKVNVRQGLVDAFGAGSAMANSIAPHLKMNASRAQKLYSTGTGTTAAPATMEAGITEDFRVTFNDVDSALNLP